MGQGRGWGYLVREDGVAFLDEMISGSWIDDDGFYYTRLASCVWHLAELYFAHLSLPPGLFHWIMK